MAACGLALALACGGGSDVVVNGVVLTAQQLAEFEALYRVEPVPGDYWYDPRSGLYGDAGGPATGFMYPGHTLGTLEPDASDGDSGVFVNGRELGAGEVASMALFTGPIQPGRYWFDAQGNYGVEGYPLALGNLYAGGGSGGGGGAGNFWSSRFGAGNSSADGSQGYVSVPGHGPVGYGF